MLMNEFVRSEGVIFEDIFVIFYECFFMVV